MVNDIPNWTHYLLRYDNMYIFKQLRTECAKLVVAERIRVVFIPVNAVAVRRHFADDFVQIVEAIRRRTETEEYCFKNEFENSKTVSQVSQSGIYLPTQRIPAS